MHSREHILIYISVDKMYPKVYLTRTVSTLPRYTCVNTNSVFCE